MGSKEARRRVNRSGILRRSVAVAAGLAAGSGILGTAAVAPAGAATSPTVVVVTHNEKWGTFLALKNGDTIYRLATDPLNKSTCSGACAKAWPPVLLASGQAKPAGDGVSGLGSIARARGARQVTYKGVPLYLFIGDHKAHQVNGNIKDTWGQWWVVNPAHPLAVPAAAKSSGGSASPTTTAPAGGSGVAY
ncbi:MAG: hypothetical protein ACLPVF_00885 [Acidimicrobiales bacterium]